MVRNGGLLMSWAQAVEILQQIVGQMSSPAKGMEWLKKLEKTECGDAYRLGYCIAIDVTSGAIPSIEYARLFDALDDNEMCPRRAFAKAFAGSTGRGALQCASRLHLPSAVPERYLRVLTIGDFMTYYKKNRVLTPDDVADIREEYFSSYVPRDLSDIKEWFSGANGVVWVMSRKQYEDLLSYKTGDELATLLNDALGFGKEATQSENDGRELVGILYPADFHQVTQPTTLDAYWMDFGWYFVSYGRDNGWGQTVSCSGTNTSLGERVHREFKGLTKEFVGFPIGKILTRTIRREFLTESANLRLESILGRPTA
jgi:hypothetical protein